MAPYTGRPIKEDWVLPKERTHPKYQLQYAELQSELTASNSIEIYCVHEAGHLIFSRKAGFTQYEFLGPTMTYEYQRPDKEESQRYSYFMAAVSAPETLHIEHYDDNLLRKLARCTAAGEVFNEVLQQCPPIPIDQSWDFDTFDKHCRNALREDADIEYDAKGRWRIARTEVKTYLEGKAIEAEIQAAIAEVKYGCFDLR